MCDAASGKGWPAVECSQVAHHAIHPNALGATNGIWDILSPFLFRNGDKDSRDVAVLQW